MRRLRRSVLVVVVALLASPAANAKTYRYDGGPQPPADTTFTVAVPTIEPVTRARGPKVPLTNLQVITMVANVAFEHGLEGAPLPQGTRVVLAPGGDHPLNFVAEHAILRELGKRGVVSTIRRTPVPDDSTRVIAGDTDLILEYQVASARVTYLRLRGWLPGRVKIERQALVEARLTLRESRGTTVRWAGDATHNLVDAFPSSQVALVEDPRYESLKGEVPGRAVNKLVEPAIVIAIVAGLIALFFQNRP